MKTAQEEKNAELTEEGQYPNDYLADWFNDLADWFDAERQMRQMGNINGFS
jgi:hypothetical protein